MAERDDWLLDRLGYFTASRAFDIAGPPGIERVVAWLDKDGNRITPEAYDALPKPRKGFTAIKSASVPMRRHTYLHEVVGTMLRGKPKVINARQMDHGHLHEEAALAAYAIQTNQGDVQANKDLITRDDLQAAATPDGMVVGPQVEAPRGLVQVKCPWTAEMQVRRWAERQLEPEYFWQCQMEMLVTHAEWCDFVSYDPDMPMPAGLFIARQVPHPESQDMLLEGLEWLRTRKAELVSRLLPSFE